MNNSGQVMKRGEGCSRKQEIVGEREQKAMKKSRGWDEERGQEIIFNGFHMACFMHKELERSQ